jgi:hypothetical protein
MRIRGFRENGIMWVQWSNRFAKLDGKSTWDPSKLNCPPKLIDPNHY